MKLTVIGSSPSWPNPDGAQSGYLVERPGRLLLDCGPGVLARLLHTVTWPDVQAIAITHFHLDHWGDLVPWVWGSLVGPGAGTARPELHVPPGGRDHLAGLALALGGMRDMFESAFTILEYAEGAATMVAGFELVPTRVPHFTTEAYGFRVSDGERVLAYSGDTGPSGRLVDLARDSDLFLCEATLGDSGEPEPRGHLTAAEADEAFAASGARRLVITHRPHERPLGPGLEVAHDGLEIEI